MNGQLCGNCRFWWQYKGSARDRGICRSEPPQASGHSRDDWQQPNVHDDQWCGRWAPVLPPEFGATADALADAAKRGDAVAARALADHLIELDLGRARA